LDLPEAQWRPVWDQRRTQVIAFQMAADLIHRMDQMVIVIQEMDQHPTLVMESLMVLVGNSLIDENHIKKLVKDYQHSSFFYHITPNVHKKETNLRI
jgi:hypothetical protein